MTEITNPRSMKADEFKQAFLKAWRELTEDAERREMARTAYQENREWTRFMLGDKDRKGFLHEVANQLNCNVYREFYSLDCLYYQDEFDLFKGGGYPIGLDAIIEHENGDRPEEEWYKLLLWRAPLKVLIFYDWSDDDRLNNPDRANWLVSKLESFAEMTRQMRYRWPGRRDENDYLIVVGYVATGEDLPRWRWL